MKIAEKQGYNFPDTNMFAANSSWNENHNHNYNSSWHSGSNNENGTNEMNGMTNEMNGLDNTNTAQTDSSAGIGHQNYKGAELLELADETGSVSNDFTTVQSLETLSGSQFDQAYCNIMYHDHVKAINMFQNAAANLQDKQLKKYAEKTLPTLREHYDMVLNLQKKMGMQNDNSSQ